MRTYNKGNTQNVKQARKQSKELRKLKMAIALKLINYYRDQVDERVLVSLANVNFSIED